MALVASPASLKRQAEELDRLVAAAPATAAVLPHVEAFAVSVFRSLRHWIDVSLLDERIANWSLFDLGDLQKALNIVSQAPVVRGEEARRDAYIKSCRDALPRIDASTAGVDESVVASTFRVLNFDFECAVSCLVDDWKPTPLIEMITDRLRHAHAGAVRRAWRRAGDECSADTPQQYGFPFCLDDAAPLQRSFFDVDREDLRQVRSMLARYLGWFRPRLLRYERRRSSLQYSSDEFLGVARCLTLRPYSSEAAPSEWDWSIARSLGEVMRVRHVGESSIRLWHAANEILGIDDRGAIVSRFAHCIESGIPAERELMFHLRSLLTACEAAIDSTHTLGRSLHLYRLRMEVSAQDVLADLASGRLTFSPDDGTELMLQRDLCRFLLGRGIYAIGTKFGRMEMDAIVTESDDYHLIEVKLLEKPPTAEKLTKLFPQVDSYSDVLLGAPRTRSLIVFNRSDTYLTAPRQALGGECVLMFINLLRSSASQRHKRRRYSVEDGVVVNA